MSHAARGPGPGHAWERPPGWTPPSEPIRRIPPAAHSRLSTNVRVLKEAQTGSTQAGMVWDACLRIDLDRRNGREKALDAIKNLLGLILPDVQLAIEHCLTAGCEPRTILGAILHNDASDLACIARVHAVVAKALSTQHMESKKNMESPLDFLQHHKRLRKAAHQKRPLHRVVGCKIEGFYL